MSAPTVPELEELLVQPDSEDPRCEVICTCETHGDQPCGSRARWVARYRCSDCGDEHRLLVCDDCHDGIAAEGNHFVDGGPITWTAL